MNNESDRTKSMWALAAQFLFTLFEVAVIAAAAIIKEARED